jgi:hypothetical protein
LVTSNTSPNAEKTVHSIRTIVENHQLYQAIFTDCIPAFTKVRWSDRCACLNRPDDHPEGTFESAGVGSNIIRRHFNLIIEDDTVAPKKDDMTGEECMPSRDDIEQAVGFHRLTPPLLIGDKDDEQLVIGTRWADYDHINWILQNEKYAVFNRTAYKEDNVTPRYKRFSIERLESYRLSLGHYLFSALYLNKPLAKEFMSFNPDWMTYYEEADLPEEGDGVVTVDPADPPTGKSNQDYSAIVSVKHCRTGLYVRRYVRERMTDKVMIGKAFDVAEQDKATKIRIEVDRYAHLQYGFKEEMELRNRKRREKGQPDLYFMIDAVKTRGRNKEGRIRQRLQPLYENKVIKHKTGMRELEAELFAFPNGVHDDLIDALAWQIEGIHHTEVAPVPMKKRSNLPTVGEMYDSLAHRGRGSREYPFIAVSKGSNRW